VTALIAFDRYVPEPFDDLIRVTAAGATSLYTSGISLPSLHLIGANDQLVLPEASREASQLFFQPQVRPQPKSPKLPTTQTIHSHAQNKTEGLSKMTSTSQKVPETIQIYPKMSLYSLRPLQCLPFSTLLHWVRPFAYFVYGHS
jgi:hypothetical protein